MSDVLGTLAIAWAHKQKKIIDNLTEPAPFLKILPLRPANRGITHVFAQIELADGNSTDYWVDLNGVLAEVNTESALHTVDLKKIGGTLYVGADTALNYPGGVGVYFAENVPTTMKQFGREAERNILYESFRQRAIDTSNVISAGGSASGSLSSIIFVHFEDEVCQGLYNPNARRNNGLFTLQQLWGGKIGKHPTENTDVYGMNIFAYLGILMPTGDNNRHTAAIVNIDASHIPTQTQIDEALDMVRAGTGSSSVYMVMHPTVRRYLNTYNEKRIRTIIATNELKSGPSRAQLFIDWDGIPMIVSENMITTETVVS